MGAALFDRLSSSSFSSSSFSKFNDLGVSGRLSSLLLAVAATEARHGERRAIKAAGRLYSYTSRNELPLAGLTNI